MSQNIGQSNMEISKIVELSRNQNFEPIHQPSRSEVIIAIIDKALAEYEADNA